MATLGITKPQKHDYATQGFAALGQVLDSADARQLRRDFFDTVTDPHSSSPYGLLRHNVWQDIDSFRQLLYTSKLSRLACQLLNTPEVILFQDHVICKPPYLNQCIQWHQDYSYWPLDRPGGLTMWVALDPATPETGCLHYLPGTQRLGPMCPTDFMLGTNQPSTGHEPAYDWSAHEHLAVPVSLSPGQAVAHHPLVGHFSPPNTTSETRTGYSLTWVSPDVRWLPRHAPHPYLHELNPHPGQPIVGEPFLRFPAPCPE